MSIPPATTTDRDRRPIGFGIFLIVTGAVAWYAAMQLITERVALLIDPSHVLNCDVNPLVSCGTVMASPEASLFGFPNPLLGVAGLVAPIAVGVALLAGARFARWFWALFLGGVTLAWVFVMWLFGEAVYDIGALCPWCMLVWLMVIPMFWWLLTWTLSTGVLAREGGAVQRVAAAVRPFTWTIVFVNLAGIALAILVQFPTLIPSLLG
ncbi:vitamin K epoxide reductase family protein [Microcella indica]|uniref:vitamin K epoxide reductase family protein n=1 Tax=Microcella indica TaxID=2750620 RepID=UPI001FE9A866|nr:vitamin K epoxide reductase family protein [Microcella indica]